MFCRKCGATLPDDALFCHVCGEKVCTEFQSGIGTEENTNNTVPKDVNQDDSKEIRQGNKNRKKVAILAVLVGIALICGVVYLLGNGKKSANQIAALSESVLTLYVYDKSDELLGTGSGCIVGDDSTVVTNYHVIDQAYRAEAVSESNVTYNVSGVSYYDMDRDVAVLKLESGTSTTPLKLSNLDSINIGDSIYAIGSPQGLQNTVSNGIVSAIRNDGGYNYIQFTAPISPGSSGGALLNEKGKIIGIVTSYLEGQNLNFAIPSDDFETHVNDKGFDELSVIANKNRLIGNTYQNYSNGGSIVEYDGVVFHSHNRENYIYECDLESKAERKLGIQGDNLSVFQGNLYYIHDGKLCSYNLNTGFICNDVLSDFGYINNGDLYLYFITRNGYTLGYDDAVIQIDFQGKQVGEYNYGESVFFEVKLINDSEIATIDFENNKLIVISLLDFSNHSYDVGFEPNGLIVGEENVVYIDKFDDRNTLRIDLRTGETEWCLGGDYQIRVNGDKMYYCKEGEGTFVKIIGNDKSEKQISRDYNINSMCFTSDGAIYGAGSPIDSSLLDIYNYTRCLIRCDEDGSDFEVLDKWKPYA